MKATLRMSLALVMAFALTFATTVPATAATLTAGSAKTTAATTTTAKIKTTATTKTKTIYLKKKPTTITYSLTAGDKLKLKLKYAKKNVSYSKATFKSSKKTVATVSKKGFVVARKAGTTTITVKALNKTVKLKLTVKKKVTPAPKPVEPTRASITRPFMSTWDGSRQAQITLKWSVEDLDYTASNDKPNRYLTTTALTLATNIETTHPGANQWDLVYDSLDKLGFTEKKYHAYFDGDTEKPQQVNYPAMVFATHKQKVKGKNVVVAVFRGSSSFQDFITDALSQIDKYVHPDKAPSEETIGGFYRVGVNATAELEAYLKANGYTKDNTVVFITGHSLGAATASLVGLRTAATLVNPDSVFCYPFATPNYFKGLEPSLTSARMTGKNMKMFSFDNEEDIVPDVPLGLSYYKTLNRVNFDREWIEANEPARYALFNELYTYFRGRSYEADNSNFMPPEYSFKFFSDHDIQVDSIMVRNHMPYTYMALVLSELPAAEARAYIAG